MTTPRRYNSGKARLYAGRRPGAQGRCHAAAVPACARSRHADGGGPAARGAHSTSHRGMGLPLALAAACPLPRSAVDRSCRAGRQRLWLPPSSPSLHLSGAGAPACGAAGESPPRGLPARSPMPPAHRHAARPESPRREGCRPDPQCRRRTGMRRGRRVPAERVAGQIPNAAGAPACGAAGEHPPPLPSPPLPSPPLPSPPLPSPPLPSPPLPSPPHPAAQAASACRCFPRTQAANGAAAFQAVPATRGRRHVF